MKYLMFFSAMLASLFQSVLMGAELTLPQRNYSIIATDEGFYPQKLALFAGEKIHLFLTATTKKSSCFIMDEKNIFIGVSKGKISEFELYFDAPGSYRFYCPTGKIQGEFVVLEPPRKSLQKRIHN